MSEPIENKDVPEAEQTPISTATPEGNETQQKELETQQQAEKERLEELERLNKRYKEQLSGKDLLIDNLRAEKIAESLQPTYDVEPEDEYSEVPKKQPQQPQSQMSNPLAQLLVKNTITNNENAVEKKYRNDSYVPYTDEISSKVLDEVARLETKGASRLNPETFEVAYTTVRARELERSIGEAKKQAVQEVEDKEKSKLVASVESSTKPDTVETVTPSLEDVMSGKVPMSALEMIKTFPQLKGQLSKNTLNLYGIVE